MSCVPTPRVEFEDGWGGRRPCRGLGLGLAAREKRLGLAPLLLCTRDMAWNVPRFVREQWLAASLGSVEQAAFLELRGDPLLALLGARFLVGDLLAGLA